jgi:hypothetical protein
MKTLGLRVKSGYAIAVVVSGDRLSWNIDHRCEIPLSPHGDKYARFPFHPLIELEGPAAARMSRSAVAAVRAQSKRQMSAFLKSSDSIATATIVVGSLVDPESLGSSHMRAHAREGQLFREAVAKALKTAAIAYEFLRERDAYGKVATVHGCSESELRAQVSASGRGIITPWRAEEKLATVGALWKLL